MLQLSGVLIESGSVFEAVVNGANVALFLLRFGFTVYKGFGLVGSLTPLPTPRDTMTFRVNEHCKKHLQQETAGASRRTSIPPVG